MTTRSIVLFAIAQAALLALLATLGFLTYESSVAANDAYHNSLACERYASEIQLLQRVKSVANEEDTSKQLGTSEIIAIARKSSISDSSVRSIRHLSPQAIEGTDYERQDMLIDLRGVTIQQVIKLIIGMEKEMDSIRTTSLRLTATGNSSQSIGLNRHSEIWNTQLILTQLVFVATRSNS